MCIRDSYRAEGPRPLRVGGVESAIRKAASMGDGTTLLFGLDRFRVASVTRSPIGVRQVLIEGASQEQACPNCGVFSTRVHSRWIQRVKDLPYGAPVEVSWDKRRFGCDEGSCPRRTFTEVSAQLGRRRRLTLRLRHRLEAAVSRGPRSVADVAREYAVSWWSANQALIDRAADVLGPAPAGVRLLGVDETRVRRVRWLLEDSGETQRPVDDQLRRPRPGSPRWPARAGSGALRRGGDRLAGPTEPGVPGRHRGGGDRPECAVRRRPPPDPDRRPARRRP